MKNIIFRADDLGYSEGVNFGIARCVDSGIIKNVGAMVNMEAVHHGLEQLKGNDVCIGQHTNISVGKPISSPKLIPSLVDEHGQFKKSEQYRNASEDIVVLSEVILEAEAQYHRFVELTGKKPEYIDGHAVASENFFKGIQIVAKKYDLKYNPLPIHIDEPITIGKHLVYMYPGSFKDKKPEQCLQYIVNKACDNFIIIVYHPGYLDAYILENSSLTTNRVWETEFLCKTETKEFLIMNDVKSITYNKL